MAATALTDRSDQKEKSLQNGGVHIWVEQSCRYFAPAKSAFTTSLWLKPIAKLIDFDGFRYRSTHPTSWYFAYFRPYNANQGIALSALTRFDSTHLRRAVRCILWGVERNVLRRMTRIVIRCNTRGICLRLNRYQTGHPLGCAPMRRLRYWVCWFGWIKPLAGYRYNCPDAFCSWYRIRWWKR
jgi:hypothetical protein